MNQIESLGDRIAELTLAQAVQLSHYLEERHGLKPGQTIIQGQQPPPQKEEKAPEKTEFDVILDGYEEAKKISVIKTCREVTGIGLADALKFIVTQIGKPIKTGLSRVEAEALKAKMEASGAKVTIR